MDWISILVGVVTGVLANFVTNLFVTVWLPSYRNYVYKGFRVEGNWSITIANVADDNLGFVEDWKMTATLKQKAYELSGTAQANYTDEVGNASLAVYVVSGHIYDRFLSLTFRTESQKRLAYSTYLLQVSGNGSELKGYRNFYGSLREEVRAVRCTWKEIQ